MALSDEKCTDRKIDGSTNQTFAVKASNTIYRGGMVNTESGGYATAAADTASDIFQGICVGTADNSSGSAGDVDVLVYRGRFKVASSETESVASLGALRYVVDDETVAATGTVSNQVLVGIVDEFVDASTVWINPYWRTA